MEEVDISLRSRRVTFIAQYFFESCGLTRKISGYRCKGIRDKVDPFSGMLYHNAIHFMIVTPGQAPSVLRLVDEVEVYRTFGGCLPVVLHS